MAFLLSSAAAPSCSALTQLALSSALKPKADEPCQPPQARLPVGTSPESLIKTVSFLHSWFIFCELKRQKRYMWMKWGHSRSGRLLWVPTSTKSATWCWKALGTTPSRPPLSPALHSYSFKPITLVQKLPWFFFKDFLWRKSNPRRASFRIKGVN